MERNKHKQNHQRCQESAVASLCWVISPADLVKTPEANPKVVLLALWMTSSSVSKGMTDMTGPKISSFTQVMSSVQLSVDVHVGVVKPADDCRNLISKSTKVYTYQVHRETWNILLSAWGHWGQRALLHKALWLPEKKKNANHCGKQISK